jgi:hypothetical protein
MIVVSFLCRACTGRTELVWQFKGCSHIDIQSAPILLRLSARPYVPLPIGVAQHTTVIWFSRLDYQGYQSSLGSCPRSCSWRVRHTRGPAKPITSLRIFFFFGVLCSPLPNQRVPLSLTHCMASQQSILNAFRSCRVLHSLKPCARRCRASRHLSQLGRNKEPVVAAS